MKRTRNETPRTRKRDKTEGQEVEWNVPGQGYRIQELALPGLAAFAQSRAATSRRQPSTNAAAPTVDHHSLG